MSDDVDRLIEVLDNLSPMPPDNSPELTAERLDRYCEVITRVYEMLGSCETDRDTRLIEPLIRSFGYGNAYEGYWPVIHSLEMYPAEVLRPALRKALESGGAGARMWCAYMLGRQRNPEDVPVLTAALHDSEPMVRHNALKALAMVGELSARPAMEALLEDPVEEVRKMAREAIEALADQRWVVRH